MVSIENLLPVGSIVLLNDGTKRLMICGVMQSDARGNGKEYDYMGVMYPEGHLGDGFQYLFNQEDIQTVVFRGYEDVEREAFLKRLAGFYQK